MKILNHYGDFALWEGQFTPSNGEEFGDIQHGMTMVLDTRLHIWFTMKHYKMRQILQNATKSYYKIGQVYYKLR